jgi:transposase
LRTYTRDTNSMMIIAIDAHKRSHTAVRIDDNGRLLATKTVGTTTHDHLRLVKWAGEADGERRWRSRTADT